MERNTSRSNGPSPLSPSVTVLSSLVRAHMNAHLLLSTAAVAALVTCLFRMEMTWHLLSRLLVLLLLKKVASVAMTMMRPRLGAGGRGRDRRRLKCHFCAGEFRLVTRRASYLRLLSNSLISEMTG